MGLFSRIKRVVEAKANRAVESVEAQDPVGIFKNELRKLEEAIPAFEDAVNDQGAEKITLGNKIESVQAEFNKWKNEAKKAKDNGNIELATKFAEKAVDYNTELVNTQKLFEAASNRWEVSKQKLMTHKKAIKAKKAQISSLESRQKAVKANEMINNVLDDMGSSLNSLNDVNGLDAIEETVARMEAKADADQQRVEEESGDDLSKAIEESQKKSDVNDLLETL